MATATTKEPSKKAILAGQDSVPMTALMTVKERKPWGGFNSEQLKQPLIEQDVLYYVDPTVLDTDLERNGRIELDGTSMALSILAKGGIEEAITAYVPEGTTLKQIKDGKVRPMVYRGNRRTSGALLVKDMDPAFYEKNLAGRVPLKVTFTEQGLAEMAFRHDQGDQKGLSMAELAKQVKDMMRQHFDRVTIQDTLFGSFYATADDTTKSDQAQRDFDAGKIDQKALLAARRENMYGRFQTAEKLATLPTEIFKHYVYQEHANLATKDDYKVKAKLTGRNIQELDAIFRDTSKYKTLDERRAATLARFHEIIDTKAKNKSAGGKGSDSEDPNVVGRAMAKKELDKLATVMESETMVAILTGIGGNTEARRKFPQYDQLFVAIETVSKTNPDVIKALMANPEAFAKVAPTTV